MTRCLGEEARTTGRRERRHDNKEVSQWIGEKGVSTRENITCYLNSRYPNPTPEARGKASSQIHFQRCKLLPT